MSQRLVMAIIFLILANGIPSMVRAQARTTVSGSVVSPARPTFSATLVVIARQNGREVGRSDGPLPSSSSTTYPFSFSVDAGGTLQVRAYIVDSDRRIFFEAQEVTYTPGITLPVSPAPGTTPLPRGSTGIVFVLVGVLSAILAGIIAVWRRQRFRVLTRYFA